MGKRRTAAISVAALSVVCGFIIWHAVNWYLSGMYLEMFNRLEVGRGYVTVLYNLGLMLALGVSLGLLMDRVGELMGGGTLSPKDSDGKAEGGEEP
ncbi:MAG: hypothetical protein PVJ08_04030 [Dehalococcoidia bacterium]